MPSIANLFSTRRPALGKLEKHGPDIAGTPDIESKKSPIKPQLVAREQQEQLICAILSRFAQVPVSAIFVYVPYFHYDA
jgi:hypothetical protein